MRFPFPIFRVKMEKEMAYQRKETPVHTCLECGSVVYGRSDRKFCSSGCKDRWHNRKMHVYNKMRLKIMNALDRNYTILTRLLAQGIRTIDRMDIEHIGFRLDCVTSYRKTNRHDECRCFDIKYILTPTRVRDIERTPLPFSFANEVGFVFSKEADSIWND